MGETNAHPFIPNSAPRARARALEAIGISSVEELYATVPERVRFKGEDGSSRADPLGGRAAAPSWRRSLAETAAPRRA